MSEASGSCGQGRELAAGDECLMYDYAHVRLTEEAIAFERGKASQNLQNRTQFGHRTISIHVRFVILNCTIL